MLGAFCTRPCALLWLRLCLTRAVPVLRHSLTGPNGRRDHHRRTRRGKRLCLCLHVSCRGCASVLGAFCSRPCALLWLRLYLTRAFHRLSPSSCSLIGPNGRRDHHRRTRRGKRLCLCLLVSYRDFASVLGAFCTRPCALLWLRLYLTRAYYACFHRPRALSQDPTGAGTTTAEPEGVSVCAYVCLYHAEVLLAC